MAPKIRIDREVFEKLQNLGEPFVDTPNSVLRGLLGLDKEDHLKKNQVFENKEDQIKNPVRQQHQKSDSVITYSHPRLCFKSKHIEPLSDDGFFQVQTKKDGIFRFSKSDFYRVFPNVVKSLSYKEDGIYHYPVVPKKALAFKID